MNRQQKGKDKQAVVPTEPYENITCANCGDPGHPKEKCNKPAACFICKMVTHGVDDCPSRKKPHVAAWFVGSAAFGLGFYNIEVPDVNDQYTVGARNVGAVYIDGIITKEELAHNFSAIYKTTWPWQIRQLD